LPSKNEKLIPGKALIYERANGVVYARYAEDPELPRWIIGGDPGSVARAQGHLLDYSEWQQLCELAIENETLKKLMNKLVTTYYVIKDSK
jgi:hypothetical protein|tara:strand:+ start:339 stop:608 length:270 start_codon:yes stop_codon:yes gene_type:complete